MKRREFSSRKYQKGGREAVTITANEFYRFEADLATHQLLKRGWNWKKILQTSLPEIPLTHPISGAKKDVSELLAILFGDSWEENEDLSCYRHIVSNENNFPTSEEDGIPEECDCLEYDEAIHV